MGSASETYVVSREVSLSDFEKVDIRVGKVVTYKPLKGGKYSTHVLTIDLGEEIGLKKSCARLINYSDQQLNDRLVLCVVNFPPRQIGPAVSEVLTLGVPDTNGNCVLITPDKSVPLGGKLY